MLHTFLKNFQSLQSKLEMEKKRQMEAIKAKIEEKRIRKERAEAEHRAPSPSTGNGSEHMPRLKQLYLKYRWEIRMEAIK